MNCASCRKPLEENSPEELREMKEELEKDYPGCTPKECGIICDDCYSEFQIWRKKLKQERIN